MIRTATGVRDLTIKAGRSPSGEFVFKPEDSIGFLLRDTHRAFSRLLATRIAADGVTIGMWFFLRVLWEEDGLSQRELSRRIGMMEPTTVSAIDTMVKRGFATRRVDASDRRRRLVHLTAKGRALKQKLLPLAYEANLVAARTLDAADVETLRDLLSRIKQNLADESADGR